MAAQGSKDKVVFVTKEDEDAASDAYASDDASAAEEDERMGAVGPDGEIDWDCPCLQGMTKGPCGEPFKEAFACFVHSKAEPKGEDCLSEMKRMHDCILSHPEHFDTSDEESEEEGGDDDGSAKADGGEKKSDGGDSESKSDSKGDGDKKKA